jgi:nucleotide-binding universal stress UspA family protein
MATHGRGGLGRWAYGSVADKVLQGAPVPVLLVRADAAAAMLSAGWPRRLLVPLDGSDLAEQALPLATDLARRAGADLCLLASISWAFTTHAVQLISLEGPAQQVTAAYLQRVSRRLAASGMPVASTIRLEPAADAILAGAAAQRADLIVMSTHGRGGLGRWLVGSVADRVLRGATVPVLLVRAGVPVAIDAETPPSSASAAASAARTRGGS